MEFNDSKMTLIVTDGNETIKVDKKPYVHDCLDIYVEKYPQEYREAIKAIKTMTFYDGYAVADNCSLVFVYPTLKNMMERGDTFEFWEALDFYDDGLVTYYQIYYREAIKDIYVPSEIKEFLANVINSKIGNNVLTIETTNQMVMQPQMEFTPQLLDVFTKEEVCAALNRTFKKGSFVTTTFTYQGKEAHCIIKVKEFLVDDLDNETAVRGDGITCINNLEINHTFGALTRNSSVKSSTAEEISMFENAFKVFKNWTITSNDGNSIVHVQSGHTLKEWKDYCNDTETEDDRLWDFPIEELMNGAVEPNEDIIYWFIGDRLYETFECVD